MAKVIFSTPVGGDGATVQLSADDSGNLVLGATYPLAKLLGPVDSALDTFKNAIEKALGNPGWVDPILAPLDAAAKAELASFLTGA